MIQVTAEEKLDFIYNELKQQKRLRYFKLIIKLLIVWYLIYLISNFSDILVSKNLTEEISKSIWDIAKPIAEEISKDLIEQKINVNLPK